MTARITPIRASRHASLTPSQEVRDGLTSRSERGKYRVRYRDPLGTVAVADVHAQGRRRALRSARSRSTRTAASGSTRAALTIAARASGPRRSCRSAGGCRRRRRRPTGATSTGTSCRGSVSYRLGRLPAEEIENWLNDELAAGLAPSSVHRHYRTLRRMLQVAVEKQKILTNPCDRVDPPRVPKREMTFLDWEQAIALAEAHNERYRTLIYVAVDTGMRWSELVGLRRGKRRPRRRKIRVTEQLVQLEDRLVVRASRRRPTAGVRSITISPFTADDARRPPRAVRATPGPDALVFPTPPATRCRRRASRPTTSARPSAPPACRAASTTCGTRASPWPSPTAPTRRRSRSAWATARSPSRSTATATSSPSSTRRSPRRSVVR